MVHNEAILEMENVTLDFGNGAGIFDMALRLSPGTILGLIGPSGSGKTTAIRLLTGIYRPTSGNVIVFGKKPENFGNADKVRIGYIPQQAILYPHLSAEENLHFLGGVYGMEREDRQRRIDELLDFLQLQDARERLVRQLSGGMQRRLILAAALMHKPTLIFADEPTAGIDPILRNTIWERFHDLKNAGTTMIVTTQYVGEAAYCDEIALLRAGRLVTMGSPEHLRLEAMGGEIVYMKVDQETSGKVMAALDDLARVKRIELVDEQNGGIFVFVENAAQDIPYLLTQLKEKAGVVPEKAEPYMMNFDEVFTRLIQETEES